MSKKYLLEDEFYEDDYKEFDYSEYCAMPDDEDYEISDGTSADYDVIVDTLNDNSLDNVIGHSDQKKELLNVIKWFKNSEELRSKGVTIPKGVLLFGNPGNGKSFLIKQIIKSIGTKVFVFKGGSNNITEAINDMFKEARKEKKAVVVIDELDLLINNDRRVIRALQENLDGIENSDNILILSATNNISEIPDPLMRNGRLEKVIKIPYLDEGELVTLLKKHFKEFNIELPEGFDDEEVGLQLKGLACSGVKAIVNDLVLRNGFENLTIEMLDESISNISKRVKDKTKEGNLQVAIHEASHAVIAYNFPKYFKVNKLNMNGYSGCFVAKEVEEDFWSYKKALANIKITLAGNIAEKLIFKDGSLGAEEDLQKARRQAYNLININGYSSCWETLPVVSGQSRVETQIKRRKNEIKIEKMLKKCEKATYKIVKKNIDKIKALADALFEKKRLKSSEILAIIS